MIPKIIHQVWDGRRDRLPEQFKRFGETWRETHPEWRYERWDWKRMDALVRKYYPDLASVYFGYGHDIQRWNAIRYMILDTYGGVYVDFDCECLEPMDEHLRGKSCCLGLEPQQHSQMLGCDRVISPSFIAAEKGHSFLKRIIESLPVIKTRVQDKVRSVHETTGSLMLTDLYEMWPAKEQVSLLPSSLVSPLTRTEVQMFLRGELDEEIMEDKLTDAFAIHYYWHSWQNGTERTKADVLYLSVSSGTGGSARAAYRIHCGLRDHGIDSVMLAGSSSTQSPSVYTAQRRRRQAHPNDYELLERYRVDPNSMFWPAAAGIDIQRYIKQFNPAIVQMHWTSWAGFLRIEDMAKIGKKIVWRLPDNWAMTGGCHNLKTCIGYMYECGKCPQLNSDKQNDLSHQVWLRKKAAYQEMDITVVVPTEWMREKVLKSSLLCDRRVELIPNGLDVDLFSPLDKAAARKMLGVAPRRKLILYGAYNAVKDPRKGFDLLKEALKKLSVTHGDDYEVVVFGADEVPIELDMPIRFLGYLKDHLSLQVAYSAADVMIVPSIEEAFGQTVTEAMACATPVVVFSDTGPAGIVEHLKTGYVARHSDTDDLARGIEWVLEDDRRLKTLSRNARKKVLKTYDIRLVAQQYARLYDSLK
jgi:glycosyltransferase involved in cell wall biosynthesis